MVHNETLFLNRSVFPCPSAYQHNQRKLFTITTLKPAGCPVNTENVFQKFKGRHCLEPSYSSLMSSEQHVASHPQAVVNIVIRVRDGRPWDLGVIAGRVKSLASQNITDRPAQPLFSVVKNGRSVRLITNSHLVPIYSSPLLLEQTLCYFNWRKIESENQLSRLFVFRLLACSLA
jgi:hypothetical protein